MKRTAGLVMVALVACLAGPVGAADWPEWRGPGRDGVAEDAPSLVESLPEEPHPLWSAPVGEGKIKSHASPVVAAGQAYLHTAEEVRVTEDGKERKRSREILMCVSMADGKELWRVQGEGDCHNTPCLAGGNLYYVTAQGVLACLDAATGEQKWTRNLGKRGTNASPAVAGAVVAVLIGKELTAHDAASGEPRWTVEVPSWNNSPAVWHHAGKTYLVAGNREIVCLEADTGREAWRMAGTTLQRDPSSPVIRGDLMVTLFEGSGLTVHRLRPDGAEKVATAEGFVPQDGGAHQAMTPAFDGRRVWAVDKEKTFCWDLETGKIAWTGPKGDTHGSPVVAGPRLLVSAKRTLHMLDAETGAELGEAKIDAVGCSSCALVGDRLVVNEGEALRCYDLGAK